MAILFLLLYGVIYAAAATTLLDNSPNVNIDPDKIKVEIEE